VEVGIELARVELAGRGEGTGKAWRRYGGTYSGETGRARDDGEGGEL
jgi:hypothetical protein